MNYRLILSEPSADGTKALGEDVYLEDLANNFNVYLLYYSGAKPDDELESGLRRLGKATGNNLFVNIGRLGDPNYKKIKNKFGLKNLPAIVITGVEELAAAKSEPATAYVRLDGKALLSSPTAAVECVEKIFNLYIEGKISEAMRAGKRDQFLARIKELVMIPLRGIKDIVDDRDISISVITGTFTLKRSGK